MNDYIWIVRWGDFQHYKPERDRAPAWLKTYTKELDDERYLRLTTHQRALLHDLRRAFARTHGRLARDSRQLTHRFHVRVTSAQLEALNHAGFIDFCSREVLEHRLELLYTSRARDRAHHPEVEEEKEQEPSVQPSTREPARPTADTPWDGEDPDGLTEHDLTQNGLPDLEHVLKEIPR